MIYAKRKHLYRYKGLSSTLDTAIAYLETADLSKLPNGRNAVDNDLVFINRFDYHTVSEDQAIWEGHIQYGDIHVLLSGNEKIGVSNANALKVTTQSPTDDFIGYEGPVETWVPMTPEDILIVFPEDVHMVKVIDGESSLVKKACFKFKVN